MVATDSVECVCSDSAAAGQVSVAVGRTAGLVAVQDSIVGTIGLEYWGLEMAQRGCLVQPRVVHTEQVVHSQVLRRIALEGVLELVPRFHRIRKLVPRICSFLEPWRERPPDGSRVYVVRNAGCLGRGISRVMFEARCVFCGKRR